MKIDLHVHTQERSSCAHSTEDEQIQAAISAGLDAIVITDHARLVPPERIDSLNRRYAPFRVFGGIEIDTGGKPQGEHILVFGIHDQILEREDWAYADLHAFIRSRQGFMALAHPFRYRAHIDLPLEQYPVDAIEVFSHNTPPAAEAEIRFIASRLGLTLVSNSDAHTAEKLGKHYNILPQEVEDENNLVSLLKAGPFRLKPDPLV